jgi:hypothetical protein
MLYDQVKCNLLSYRNWGGGGIWFKIRTIVTITYTHGSESFGLQSQGIS